MLLNIFNKNLVTFTTCSTLFVASIKIILAKRLNTSLNYFLFVVGPITFTSKPIGVALCKGQREPAQS